MTRKAIMFFSLAVLAAGLMHGVQQVKVKVDKANVREAADPGAAIIRVASRDEVFTVLERAGAWYKIALPGSGPGEPQVGYINKILVSEMGEASATAEAKPAGEAPPPKEKTAPPRKKTVAPSRTWEPEKKLFSGLSLKFGLMTSPKAENFGNKWILGIATDMGLNRYLSLGLELQPYLRSYSDDSIPDVSLSLIGAHVFLNVKAGANLGQFVPFLKFWKPYLGFGAGGAFAMQKVKYLTSSDSEFKANFAWHWMLGSEFVLKGIDLIFEYQAIKVAVPDVDPDFFTHFLMFGVRF